MNPLTVTFSPFIYTERESWTKKFKKVGLMLVLKII